MTVATIGILLATIVVTGALTGNIGFKVSNYQLPEANLESVDRD
jgi:hypothetical protein